jgi:hypothetical protein
VQGFLVCLVDVMLQDVMKGAKHLILHHAAEDIRLVLG